MNLRSRVLATHTSAVFLAATFVVTFFVAQSLSFWRSVYLNARSVSSRLSDLGLLLTANAARGADGKLTDGSNVFLCECARRMRLFQVLYWSGAVKRFAVVHSDDGLRELQAKGFLTPPELELLLASGLPKNQRLHTVMAWIASSASVGTRSGG